jgi:hypothetical protein
MNNPETRSVPTLLSDLAQQVSTLVRTEAKLLRTELSEKAGKLGTGATEIAAGAVLLLAALLVLLQALVVALANMGLGAGWASLLVGIVVAAIGAFLVRKGSQDMSPSGLTPDRTTEQLRQDMQVAKEQIR